jgi:hypothetical protein
LLTKSLVSSTSIYGIGSVNKGFEQRVMLNEMFHDIGRPEQFDPPHSAKAQRFF